MAQFSSKPIYSSLLCRPGDGSRAPNGPAEGEGRPVSSRLRALPLHAPAVAGVAECVRGRRRREH